MKKIFGFLLVLLLLIFVTTSGFAIIKGLEGEKSSMVKVGESVIVPEGSEVETAVSVGGSVTVLGHVIKDVVGVGGSVTLKNSAVVGGDAVSVGGKVIREPKAIVKGDVVEVAVPGVSPAVTMLTKGGALKGLAFFGLLSFIGVIVLTIMMVALFTPQLGKISASIEARFWKNMWMGILIVVLFVPIIFILAVSIIGIPLIPLWILLVLVAGLFGYFAAGHLLGKKILNAFRIRGRSMMAETLTGVILLCLLDFVPVIGFCVKAVVALSGLGGAYRTRCGTR